MTFYKIKFKLVYMFGKTKEWNSDKLVVLPSVCFCVNLSLLQHNILSQPIIKNIKTQTTELWSPVYHSDSETKE